MDMEYFTVEELKQMVEAQHLLDSMEEIGPERRRELVAIVRALAELHKNRGRLAVMRAACLRLAHPEAAAVVGTNLLEGLRSVPKPIPTPSTVQATRLSDGKSAETAR